MRPNRQPEPRHRPDGGHVAADRRQDDAGADIAGWRAHADDAIAVEAQTRDRRALMNIDAEAGRAFGERPDDAVVAGRRPCGVVRAAEDRPVAAACEVEL